MDSVESDQNWDDTEQMCVEQVHPTDDPDAWCVFGESEIVPRIGEQYQVDIPPLIGDSDYLLTKNPNVEKHIEGLPCDFHVGLTLPLMSINQDAEDIKRERLEAFGGSKVASNESRSLELESFWTQISQNENSEVHIEQSDITINSALAKGESQSASPEDKLQLHKGSGYCLVPGVAVGTWSNVEKSSFLLGLYIFGKNFVQLKRFTGSKSMGDVQSFYYGKFCGSPQYRRWSDCRKTRNRRSIYGQKIFTGPRQQELLSRLIPGISEECQNSLLEVSRTFVEGKMSLEEYVFALKAMVGMETLIEAVAIGNGTRDLTTMRLESARSSHSIPVRPGMPSGKACSSLAPHEILKFLTGAYRLSKARSNDLFWEAVWPRLLARGWHSEQPKHLVYAAGSNHSLVFLVPGITKFSRRRLVKGNHYFDSIPDVLTKVASEPELLEFEAEEDERNRSKEEESEQSNKRKLEKEDLSKARHHCYLQPRIPNRNSGVFKFTVVDTSLDGRKPFKVRDLRGIPLELPNKLSAGTCCEYSNEECPDISTDDSDSESTMLLAEPKKDNAHAACSYNKDQEVLNLRFQNSSLWNSSKNELSAYKPVDNSKNTTKLCDKKQSRKRESSQKLEEEYADKTSPVIKQRRRLTACDNSRSSNLTFNSSVVPKAESEMPYSAISDCTKNDPLGPSPQDKLSSTRSSKSSPAESIEIENHDVLEQTHVESQSRFVIDLNIPQIPPDLEDGIILMEEQCDSASREIDGQPEAKVHASAIIMEEQPNLNTRRHGTRNRPPTRRALEALANGFLTANRRQKNNKSRNLT